MGIILREINARTEQVLRTKPYKSLQGANCALTRRLKLYNDLNKYSISENKFDVYVNLIENGKVIKRMSGNYFTGEYEITIIALR